MKNWSVNFLHGLFAEFSNKNIDAVLLRSYDWLDNNPDGDLDLLVHPSNVKAAEDILLRYASEQQWQCIFKDKDANHFHSVYIRKNEQTIQTMHIDFQVSLGRKGFLYCPASIVMANPVNTNGILTQNNTSVTYSLLLHVLLDKNNIKEQYRKLILEADISKLESFLILNLGDKQLVSRIIQWIEQDLEPDKYISISQHTRKALKKKYLRNYIYPGLHKIRRMLRYFGKTKGALVAMLGPDGAGKSTILDLTQKQITGGAFPVSIAYMGKRDAYLPTSKLIRLIYNFKDRKKTIEMAEKVSADPNEKKDSVTVKKASALFYIKDVLGFANWLLEQWARYFIEIRPLLQQGGVVLCDRYSFDLANRPGHSIVFNKTFLRLLPYLFPSPNITYLLWETPEVLYNRKKENTYEKSSALINNYRQLLTHIPHTIEVRTNISADTISQNIALDIAEVMKKY